MNFNRILIGGKLTRDPELRYTPKGTAVCHVGLATNRRYKADSGDTKEVVCFVDGVAFGRTAEAIGKHFKKGHGIFVEGELKFEQWDDKTTGGRRSKHVVGIETFRFVGARTGKTEGAGAPDEVAPSPSGEPDDVPF